MLRVPRNTSPNHRELYIHLKGTTSANAFGYMGQYFGIVSNDCDLFWRYCPHVEACCLRWSVVACSLILEQLCDLYILYDYVDYNLSTNELGSVGGILTVDMIDVGYFSTRAKQASVQAAR